MKIISQHRAKKRKLGDLPAPAELADALQRQIDLDCAHDSIIPDSSRFIRRIGRSILVIGFAARDNDFMETRLPPVGQIAELGKKYYQVNLAKVLEPQHNGKYLVLDVDSGDYEVDAEHMPALLRLQERYPNKIFYAVRVGYGVLFSLGGRMGPPLKIEFLSDGPNGVPNAGSA